MAKQIEFNRTQHITIVYAVADGLNALSQSRFEDAIVHLQEAIRMIRARIAEQEQDPKDPRR